MNFIMQQYNRKMSTSGASIDKISKLLDVLDKHIKEENCQHSPKELFEEYEIDDSLKSKV
jgi:hypothetical protein